MKTQFPYLNQISIAIFAIVFFIISCEKEQMQEKLEHAKGLKSQEQIIFEPNNNYNCGAKEFTLWADKNIDVGSVSVYNDSEFLYLTYTLSIDYAEFSTILLWVGKDLAELPVAGKGQPIPGLFPYKAREGENEFKIPLADYECEETKFYIVTHAGFINFNANGKRIGKEGSAFGGNFRGDGPRWYYWDYYKICCDIVPWEDAFVTFWDVPGKGDAVALALAGEVDAIIYWGDGSVSFVKTPGPHIHYYEEGGDYRVAVTGTVTAYNTKDHGHTSSRNLLGVQSWGKLGFTSMRNAFYGTELYWVPSNSDGLDNVTDMSYMFSSAGEFFTGNLSNWDVSNVTNMAGMFEGCVNFRGSFSGWDVSNVKDMSKMFQHVIWGMISDLSEWDVSNVTNMNSMFYEAENFDEDIGGWNVSNVTNMDRMFLDATSFNQDLSGWCVRLIPVKPDSFDSSANRWLLPRPVWGTCPE